MASPTDDSLKEMVQPVALRCGGVLSALGSFIGGIGTLISRLFFDPSPLLVPLYGFIAHTRTLLWHTYFEVCLLAFS